MPGIRELTTYFILNLTLSPLFSTPPSDSVLTGFKIDHVNIAVKDLEAAKGQYKKLGFSIKPGRLHRNGILNAFTKFKDGNLLELITSSKEADELSSWYLQFIQKNPAGAGAFIALKVESKSKLEILKRHFTKRGLACDYSNTGYSQTLSFDKDHLLHPLFFISYEGKIKDKSVHLNHPNTAQSLHAVWLGTELAAPLKKGIGFKGASKIELPFFPEAATRIKLEQGEIYILPDLQNERISGVTLLVENVKTAKSIITKGTGKNFNLYTTQRGESFAVPPELTFGIWIEFLEVN